MARNTLTLLITLFLFIVNFIAFATAGKYLYIRDNLNDAIGGIKLLKHLVHYVNFILDCLAAIYLIAAGWTCLTCLYTFVSIPCGWKGSTACHFDFFITLISACFQCSIGVLSAINTLLLQQNFSTLIANSSQLNILQQLGASVAILYFIGIFPAMGFLLHKKWEVLSRQVIQEDRFQRQVKLMVK